MRMNQFLSRVFVAAMFALVSVPLSADTVEFDFENLDQTGAINNGPIGTTITGLNVVGGTDSTLTLQTVDVIAGASSLSNGDSVNATVNNAQFALGIGDNHFNPGESYVFSFNQNVNVTTITLESFSAGNNFTVSSGGTTIGLTALADPDNNEFSVNDLGDSLSVAAGEDVTLSFVGGGPNLVRVVNIQAAIAAVPEPSSLALIALGSIGMIVRRKRV